MNNKFDLKQTKDKIKDLFKPKSLEELQNDYKKIGDDWKSISSQFKKRGTLFGKKCPKCDSKNIKTLKPSFTKKWGEASVHAFTFGLGKITPNLNVCRDCGFSWEDR